MRITLRISHCRSSAFIYLFTYLFANDYAGLSLKTDIGTIKHIIHTQIKMKDRLAWLRSQKG